MTDRWTSTSDRPDSGRHRAAPSPQLHATPRPSAGQNRDRDELAEAETMLRTAIEALSPDADEIRQDLARRQEGKTARQERQSSFRLILTIVILVFMILVLDLLLT